MEPQPIYYKTENYLETSTGNKISRSCLIRGSD